jgi:plastocyanin
MKLRVHMGLAAAALTVALAAGACGGTQPGQADPAAEPAVVANPVDPATAGSITGRIAFTGTPPPPQPIKTASDPNCQTALTTEAVVVNGGGLQNVFVYVKDGLGNLRFPVPATPVVLDQKGCRYVPHVLGIQVGQPMQIVSSDPTLHNVHAVAEANREFNTGQPVPGVPHTHSFSTTEVMVPFKCDVHRWMNAFVGVVDHPFYAVSAADGRFELKGLPPGTYTIEAWHEQLGTQTQTVTIGEKETKDVGFSFTSRTT